MTKIIFSRKGFDSSAGGIPSSKRGEHLISFPIPYKKNTLTRYNHVGLGKDIKELSNNKIKPTDTCHFDPNLDYGEFGQVGAAQTHLKNNNRLDFGACRAQSAQSIYLDIAQKT